jgi:hypothetical protein
MQQRLDIERDLQCLVAVAVACAGGNDGALREPVGLVQELRYAAQPASVARIERSEIRGRRCGLN